MNSSKQIKVAVEGAIELIFLTLASQLLLSMFFNPSIDYQSFHTTPDIIDAEDVHNKPQFGIVCRYVM